MKRSIIWLLSTVMAFAFIGLLVLQVQYIATLFKLNNETFDITVRNCLKNVSYELEQEEVKKYIEEYSSEDGTEYMYKNSPNMQSINQKMATINYYSYAEVSKKDSTITYKGMQTEHTIIQKPQSRKNTISTIVESSEELQKLTRDRYSHLRGMVEDVTSKMTKSAHLKPIEQRIDFKALQKNIADEFANNELTLPFVLMVVNNSDRIVFQSEPLSRLPKNSDIVTQVIFPDDLPSKHNYLKVYFPTKKSYLSSSISFLVPSIIFSLILLIIFTITLYIILRQKKLSEMKNDFIN
ncbi:MAG: two-component sensor histidine kinase, partial [Tannerella sp.]|nr:two-component sensor histidine kinase [Tannerella sp.]